MITCLRKRASSLARVRLALLTIALFAGSLALASVLRGQSPAGTDNSSPQSAELNASDYVPKTKSQLRRSLSSLQYRVTQEEHTEPAFTGKYWNHKKDGIYTCVVCGLSLFDSQTKFDSGTGWPSFFAPINKEHVGTKVDHKMAYPRNEVHCQRCGAHLGHVFDDGPRPTGLRFCMNSASLGFKERKDAPKGDAPGKP